MSPTRKPQVKPRKLPVEFPFQLVGLRIHELSARRAVQDEPLPKTLPLSVKLVAPSEAEQGPLRRQLLVFDTAAPDSDGRVCHIHLSVEARFERASGSKPLPAPVLADFEAQHVIVLIWPYLRQYLFDLTTKMELAVPPLPVVDPRALVASLTKSKDSRKSRSAPKQTPHSRKGSSSA